MNGPKWENEQNCVNESDGIEVGQAIQVIKGRYTNKTAFVRKIEIPKVHFQIEGSGAIFYCQLKAEMGMSKDDLGIFKLNRDDLTPNNNITKYHE